ncbi:ferroxidase FET5 SCDLUD_000850 [Saccharomycodes ludwigii]|nr:hypothetical protein SCDLUD_000850 [Saccharomycodes ludwigii]KAH3903229.1 hypothetical protein SCDLUD_000850 [Saccharomycodes ludwigii]
MKTHTFHFNVSWVDANPDGQYSTKKMIGFNGIWPPPDIHVERGDRVEIYLTNDFANGNAVSATSNSDYLSDLPTSLHFHGLFQNTSMGNSPQMDGPEMVTQCPIMPGQTYLYNITVPDQLGTYWYHSHSGSQYTDGMRGAFIIHDYHLEKEVWKIDDEFVIQLSDYYYEPYYKVFKKFLSRYNPTGAEPIPQNFLFNNTDNGSLNFDYDKLYLLRFINSGTFVAQLIHSKDHEFNIVEVDGVLIKSIKTHTIELAPGQRLAVLVKSKSEEDVLLDNDKNDNDYTYPLFQIIDERMLDVIPENLELNKTNLIHYPGRRKRSTTIASSFDTDVSHKDISANYHFGSAKLNDFNMTPLDKEEILDTYDYQIKLEIRMDNLGDGVNYAFFNNITYVAPKVPSLFTALTADKKDSLNPLIYGDNLNAFVLQHNEVIEVVLDNYDDGRHPFHLHGHTFQIVQKTFEEFEEPKPYNESAPLMEYPMTPMKRDTVIVEGNGHVVLRFRADNPGVWLFHCHVDWHLEQGLAAVFIEAPDVLQVTDNGGALNENMKQICQEQNIPVAGNAVGNQKDWFDLTGLPRQPKPLPNGFTLKGYLAFITSALIAFYGLFVIVDYGLDEKDFSTAQELEMYHKLETLLLGEEYRSNDDGSDIETTIQ